ncbi:MULTISPECIES: DUF917 domain-containing protein [unclassified Arthrobacter]|uniref:DUF917 domain-containing protein n=1 Tax=unclassified Arthrobacter TaxID=235627 RepID=UPI001D2DE9E9|nr:DUF917 domain-containing protein [Arthrobacter sp. Bi26]CAH0274548.1 hypothetical protein SRABI26_03761 [Arthrobacter sp. Bi26]
MTLEVTHVRKLTRITVDDIDSLARGAAILGTGGGGDPYVGGLLARKAIEEYGPVELVSVEDLADDAFIVPIAAIGAPTVSVEKLDTVENLSLTIKKLAATLNRVATHTACLEIGGSNSMLPIVAAAQLGIPLIDGDLIGRAFPEIQMGMAPLYGIQASPMALADEKGNSLVIEAIDSFWGERFARQASIEMGCNAFNSTYAMTGAQARESFVAGSMSFAITIGDAVANAQHNNLNPCDVLAETLRGRIVHLGKVTDLQRQTTGGFAKGQATIEGMGADAGSILSLHFQNEHLLATKDGTVVTTTPDLIIVVDAESAEPITTENLRYGQRVCVLTGPSDPRWHTTEGLELAGPGYFGYGVPSHRWDGTPEEHTESIERYRV